MGMRRTVGGFGLRMGRALVRLARRTRPPLSGVAAREVLACSPLRIGDAVQIEPALRALRAAWPSARLTLALRPLVAPLGTAFAAADAVIPYRGGRDLRRGLSARPDVAVSFGLRFGAAWTARRSGAARVVGYDDAGRGMLLTDPVPAPGWVNRPIPAYPGLVPVPQGRFWLDMLAAVGVPGAAGADAVPVLRVPDEARAAAAQLLSEAGLAPDTPFAVCHPGAEPSYRWPPERWRAVCGALAARGLRVVLGGGPGDRAVAAAIQAPAGTVDLTGRTGLPEYLALLARASLLVAVDTSATHLAAATGTPVVALFGAGDPRIWAPAGPGHTVIQGVNADCYGCTRPACYPPRHYCMEAVSTEDVIHAALAATP